MKDQKSFEEKLKYLDSITLIGPLLDDSYPYEAKGALIFVDGGANFLTLFSDLKNEIPSLSLGDGDSSKVELDIKLNPKKDFSDLGFALSLIPQNIKNVFLLGFLGGRRDHEIANLGEIHQFLKKRKDQTKVFFEDKIIAISKNSYTKNITGTFSLMVLENTPLKIEGACQYPTKAFIDFLPLSSLGLSNIGSGNVIFEASNPFFIFLADQPVT
jgi:thiamine pyrophosphokinase